MGYWWVELGGEQNCIWDHIKNRCSNRDCAAKWALEWIQFLPAKRESRRYIGAHVLTQNDVEAKGPFKDIVAYGGWPMDDHHPGGFEAVKIGAPATIYHEAPSPYGIPYRCLYSRNVSNLMFAGRDASCSHAAMSSTRVMGTGCSMGQAVGTAAALAAVKRIPPATVNEHIHELQQALIRDDAYLPGVAQEFSAIIAQARLTASCGDPELVRNGLSRPVGDDDNCWTCKAGDWIAYEFQNPIEINRVTIILDSGLDQNVAMSYHQQDNQRTSPPSVMPKAFAVEVLTGDQWEKLAHVDRNHQRFCRFPVKRIVRGVRVVLEETWGSEQSRLYAFYME